MSFEIYKCLMLGFISLLMILLLFSFTALTIASCGITVSPIVLGIATFGLSLFGPLSKGMLIAFTILQGVHLALQSFLFGNTIKRVIEKDPLLFRHEFEELRIGLKYLGLIEEKSISPSFV